MNIKEVMRNLDSIFRIFFPEVMGNLWRKTSYFEKFLSGWWKPIEDDPILRKYSKGLRVTPGDVHI